MKNYFLKVNKDLFKLKLNPTEILLLAQIMEFQSNTGDCFMSDEALAENFGVSKSTISRSIKSLVEKGFIARDTKNIKGGKERHITVNIDNIEKALTNVNLPIVEKEEISQTSNCLLSNVNLPIVNGQNDFIKDKRKDNSKDKSSLPHTAEACTSAPPQAALQIQPVGEKEGFVF